MKKILVTAAGGFIGSHLVERLVELGYSVKAFLRYNSKGSWGWLEESNYKNSIEMISGDIRDYDSVFSAMKNVDTVFHLAALIGIPYSYVSPLAYIKTNIEGTYNILQSAWKRELKNILITSTSEIYGTAQYVPMDEAHPAKAQSPYSASKIAADQLSLSYYNSFNLPVKIVRPFNTYGPRQSARAFIPTVITQMLSDKPKIEIGNMSPTRDLTYVKDTVKGFIEIFTSEKLFGKVANIGMNKEISMYDLTLKIGRLTKKSVELVADQKRTRPDKSEVMRLCCDNTKLKKSTNWENAYDLDSGLMETIDWFRMNLAKYKSNIYNI